MLCWLIPFLLLWLQTETVIHRLHVTTTPVQLKILPGFPPPGNSSRQPTVARLRAVSEARKRHGPTAVVQLLHSQNGVPRQIVNQALGSARP